jgi:hypothetical protein
MASVGISILRDARSRIYGAGPFSLQQKQDANDFTEATSHDTSRKLE